MVGTKVGGALVAVGASCCVGATVPTGWSVSAGRTNVARGVGVLSPGKLQPDNSSNRTRLISTSRTSVFFMGTSCR